MTLKEAIEVLKKFKEWANTPTHGSSKYDLIKLSEAIDTVVAEVEKPLPTDVINLLERASNLVGNPGTNISSSINFACYDWQKDYMKWKEETK